MRCQSWPFSSFSVLFSPAFYRNSDQDWKQKLVYFFRCLSYACLRMFSSLVSCKKWQSSIYWRRSLRIRRLSLTFLSTMTVMSMPQTSLKGTALVCYFFTFHAFDAIRTWSPSGYSLFSVLVLIFFEAWSLHIWMKIFKFGGSWILLRR